MIVSGFVAFILKKPNITVSYPSTHQVRSTNNLICQREITNSIGAIDRCDGKKTYGFIGAGKEQLVEALRIDQTDQWISKKAFDKLKISFRTANGIIYIKGKNLIKEIEDGNRERQYLITIEDSKKIIAHSLEMASLATSSASLFLDKSKGLLLINDTSTYLYCRESLVSHSTLYSCQEN